MQTKELVLQIVNTGDETMTNIKQDGSIELRNISALPVIVKEFNKEKAIFEKIKLKLFLAIKRVFDIVCSLIGMIAILPLMLIIKASYMLSGDFKSILYKQIRVGKDGKKFKLYKFRSMVWNADQVLEELLEQDEYREEWEQFQKFDNDPRITRVGKILRKTSLDELPQMFNILKGDMSIIGPRPLVVGELDDHNGNHMIYESVRPGLSGYWAVNGRSAKSYEERLQLEYYYCNNASLLLDIKILFLTAYVVLKRDGAK